MMQGVSNNTYNVSSNLTSNENMTLSDYFSANGLEFNNKYSNQIQAENKQARQQNSIFSSADSTQNSNSGLTYDENLRQILGDKLYNVQFYQLGNKLLPMRIRSSSSSNKSFTSKNYMPFNINISTPNLKYNSLLSKYNISAANTQNVTNA